MKSTYTALGLSNTGHVELSEHNSQTHCREWIQSYTRWGDWGGYDGIAITAPNGDWIEVLEPEHTDA